MIVKLFNNNTEERKIREIVRELNNGKIIVIPTDTVYAIACSLQNKSAIERIQGVKNGKEINEMSILCADLTGVSKYAKISDVAFSALRKNLPGAFTFILPATQKTPEKILQKRSTIGIRIPDSAITLAIIRELGCPLLATSVELTGGEDEEYLTDPSLIEEKYSEVDIVVDGGIGVNIPSTVVDCTDDIVVIRQGAAELR
ncbi:MAG: L-threonylcarbamoyladenylate synthase [Rikenellaceae bacterium]